MQQEKEEATLQKPIELEERQFQISPPASPEHESIFQERSRRTTHTKTAPTTDPIVQFYNQAHQNIEKLIMIRSSWDAYLVIDSSGTRIPQHFLDPPLPSSVAWEKYIVS